MNDDVHAKIAIGSGAVEWELQGIRAAIAADWQRLASGHLSADERRAVREHLGMNLAALRDLRDRSRLTTQANRMRQLREGH